MDKKEMRAEYERVYGKTAPISCEMFYNLSSEELKRSYNSHNKKIPFEKNFNGEFFLHFLR